MPTSTKHPKLCKVCGGYCYSSCGICDIPLHIMPAKGMHSGNRCFFDYNDDAFFGMVRSEFNLSGIKRSEWAYPSSIKQKNHA